MNIQPLDLFAEARSLAGTNPQHTLMIRLARARLRRLAVHFDRLREVADFALAAVEREKDRIKIFAEDMKRELESPDAARRLQEVIVTLPLKSGVLSPC